MPSLAPREINHCTRITSSHHIGLAPHTDASTPTYALEERISDTDGGRGRDLAASQGPLANPSAFLDIVYLMSVSRTVCFYTRTCSLFHRRTDCKINISVPWVVG